MNATPFPPDLVAGDLTAADGRRLIADFGQPNFPFWRFLLCLALAAQALVVVQSALGGDFDQVRARRGGSRIVRVRPPNRRQGAGR